MTTESLRCCIEDELRKWGSVQDPISKGLIKSDIEKLRKDYGMNVQFSFQSNSYHYSSPNDTFLNLTEEFLQNLRFALQMQLISLEGTAYFQWEASNSSIPDKTFLNQILKAILDRHKIEFKFRPVNSKRNFFYRVDPLLIIQYRDAWHLRGINNADDCINDFTLHRIVGEITTTNIGFKYPEMKITAPLQPSFASLGSKPTTILIDCKIEHRAWFFIHPIHPSQKVVHNNKRGLRISLTVNIDETLISKLLSLSSLAEVVSPAVLRVFLYDELKKMIQLYSYYRA